MNPQGATKKNAISAVLTLAALLLAGIPPLVVILRRWFDLSESGDSLHNFFCQNSWLCRIQFPGDFFAALAAVVAAMGLVFVLCAPPPAHIGSVFLYQPQHVSPFRRKIFWWLLAAAGAAWLISLLRMLIKSSFTWSDSTRPGWEMSLAFVFFLGAWIARELDLRSLWQAAWNQRDRVLSLALFFAVLPFMLREMNENRPFQWAVALLFLFSALNLLRFLPLPPIFWILVFSTVVATIQINHWRTSGVGDEYSFYSVAAEIVERPDQARLGERLFDGQGVYGTHPFFSSVLQALSMVLWGTQSFGWRFSNVVAIAASVGLWYAFLHLTTNRRIALIGAALLGCAHYLLVFSKIGYNNLQALLALAGVLAAAAWALRRRSPLTYVAVGFAAGFCFYVYPAALYAVPLPFLLAALLDRPFQWKGWLLAAGAMLLTASPLLIQPDYWQRKIPGTFLFSEQITSSPVEMMYHFASNILYALFSYLYIPEPSHFVVSSYLDPISGLFATLGLALCLKWVFRRADAPAARSFSLFILTSFAWMIFAVGASHDRATPSTTRMFLLLPWFTLFASWGMAWLAERLQPLRLPRSSTATVTGVLVVLAVLTNGVMAFWLSPWLNRGGQSLEVLFLRTAREIKRQTPDVERTYIIITDPSWGVDGMRLLQRVYPEDFSQVHLMRVPVEQPELPAWIEPLIAEPSTLVFLQPWMEESWKTAIHNHLGETKKGCSILSEAGDDRFKLWYSGELPIHCPFQ